MVLLKMTGSVAICAILFQCLIRPSYDEWRRTRVLIQAQASKLDRLKRNVEIRRGVEEQSRRVPREAFLTATDEFVLAKFLRDLEVLARRPTLSLVNLKPQPVQVKATHRVYPVKLTVAGRLQEVLQFVSLVTNRPEVTGMESFSLRGVQGGNAVECTLSLWLVKLTGGPTGGLAGPAGSPEKTHGG